MAYIWIPAVASWAIDLVGHVSAGSHPWRHRWHENPYFQWIVVTGSRMRIQCENDRMALDKGDYLMLRPHTRHTSWGSDEKGTGFFYVRFLTEPAPAFRGIGMLGPVAGPYFANDNLILPEVGHIENHDLVLSRFRELISEWREQKPFYRMYIGALLQSILLEAFREGIKPLVDSGELKPGSPHRVDVLRSVLEYIDQHCHGPFRVNVMCNDLNIDYKYMARVFKIGIGISIMEYIHHKRIAKARTLLHSGCFRTIAEVGEAVGYDDPYYFSRVFHKVEGVSPKDYLTNAYGQLAR